MPIKFRISSMNEIRMGENSSDELFGEFLCQKLFPMYSETVNGERERNVNMK